MLILVGLLPKDNPPLHPVDNTWYFQLTAFVCFCAVVSAGWALAHKPKNAPSVATVAFLGIAGSIVVGLVAIFLSSIHGRHA